MQREGKYLPAPDEGTRVVRGGPVAGGNRHSLDGPMDLVVVGLAERKVDLVALVARRRLVPPIQARIRMCHKRR